MRSSHFLVALALAATACGGAEEANDQATEAAVEPTPAASVTIVEPADGAVLDAGPVRVAFEVEGLEIVPAGTMDPGTGHHHVIVNDDVDWTVPIPADPGVHIHMGQAQTETVLENLPPGEHRLIAVVADGVHIPLDPPVADTVTITIR